MRTGKCRLKAYLHAIQAEESDLCECGQKETVKHVVLDCRVWTTERQELRATLKDKDRWDDMPYLLGGWTGKKDPRGRYIDGEASSWKPDVGAVKATLDFQSRWGDSAPSREQGTEWNGQEAQEGMKETRGYTNLIGGSLAWGLGRRVCGGY